MTKKLETVTRKLVLVTERVRVLSDAELDKIGGGANVSFVSICISNGPDNDCRSVTGECRTLPPLTTGTTR